MLWKLAGRDDINRSGNLMGGGLLLGWSVFNITEGLIDHQLFKIHNVVELASDHATGNLIFLGISLLMLIAAFVIIEQQNRNEGHGGTFPHKVRRKDKHSLDM